METPAHLPSRPREFINLISDDEDGGDASPGPRPHAGHYPGIDDLNGLAFGNMLHENQVAWGAVQFEAQGVPTPIFQGWENEAPQPVPEVVVPPAGAQRLHDNQAMWKAARSEAQRVPVPMFQEWANEMPRPVPGLIVPPAAAKGLPQMFRQAERLNTNPLPVDQVHKMADNDRLNNENRLIQEVVDNPMGNYQPDNESDLILAELNSQFRNKRVDNEDMDNGNFAWEQVNRDQHNQNKPINLDSPPNEMDNKARCLEGVTEIFPDICREYIGQLYSELDGRKTVTALAELVLEKEENGKPYPKINQLKRKRPVETDDEEETMRKYMTDQRHNSEGYQSMARSILSEEFSSIPMNFIMKHINDSGVVIYTAYQNLAEAERLRDPSNPSYNKLKQARRAKLYLPHSVEEKLADPELPSEQRHALSELKDARRGRAKWQVKMAAKKQLDADETAAKLKYEADEAANLELAMKGGTMEDCGCCYDDFPRNRMVCCNNETKWHYFCKRCTRLHAETQVGNGKYELQCMSTDVCEASYSYEQRQIFLDAKLTTALDRIEAETVLRLAGIENLASCPFCPYAAEYPPVEVERLFKCELESCAKVSCRLCWKESHVPKTCKEHAKDIGLDVRREVEEAMTSAMVRLCNKCKSPFIKEEGCNKMMCPCGNIQCYVCSKSCEYDHFDDTRRGGKSGNCPLFDDVNKRHEDETKSAEKAIVEKLQKEHPGMAREDLEIKVSDAVKEDEEKRKKMRWNYNERRFYMDGAGELQRLPGDPRPLLARDRVAEREAIRARFRELGPRQNNPDLFNWEEYFNQNPQAAVAVAAPADADAADPAKPPAKPPANLFRNPIGHIRERVAERQRRHDPAPQARRDPAYQALLEAARARAAAANRDEAVGAADAAGPRRRNVRVRFAEQREEAQKEIDDSMKKRIAADEAVAAKGEEPAPKRGEDGDAEVIYRPGDPVVPRRELQDWVFEPFALAPLDGAAAVPAGNAAAARAAPVYDKDDVRSHNRLPFPLPRHPPRPPQQPEMGIEELLMQPLLDDENELDAPPEGDGDQVMGNAGLMAPNGGVQEAALTPTQRMAQILGRDVEMDMGMREFRARMRGAGGDVQGGGDMQGGDMQGGDMQGGDMQGGGNKREAGGRKEGGEYGLDLLMRLRRGKSKGEKKDKGEGTK